MRNKTIWLIVGGLALLVVLVVFLQRSGQPARSVETTASTKVTSQPSTAAQLPSHNTHIPAHYETAPSSGSLGVTLAPEQFTGKAREAYQVVKQAPQLIAQMPCYCHCDRGLGHKSLHSCFEDDHAVTCATCIDEALLAYQLQKRGLSSKQIREQIIAQFGD